MSPDWSSRAVNRPWWNRQVGLPRRNANVCSPLSSSTASRVVRPLVTVTYRSLVIDKCAPCQGVWLDCDACLCCGEALDCVLATDHGWRGTLQRSLPSVGTAGESSPVGVASRGAPTCMRPY